MAKLLPNMCKDLSSTAHVAEERMKKGKMKGREEGRRAAVKQEG